MDSHECPQRHRVNEEEFAGQQRQDTVPGGVRVRTLECSVGQGHPLWGTAQHLEFSPLNCHITLKLVM